MEFFGETAEVEEACGFEISKTVVMTAKWKYALIFGYIFNSSLKTIQNMKKYGVIRVLSKKATITWTCSG